MFAATLVYNTRRSGGFTLAGRCFVLRRVYFPSQPSPEWFIVDLLKHHDMAGIALSELRSNLVATLRLGNWDVERLRDMAATYATKGTAALVEACIAEAAPANSRFVVNPAYSTRRRVPESDPFHSLRNTMGRRAASR